ncbi:MAG TPA: YbaK/EbsC family protein [Actinomadura sp.]|jgi:prolyl-tRNA editing enzyme YbaK/EbsC (Cys-tRNA(Pro) deacylase)|nr:YbaK/EbsC family protein [Actinomadura sp.]
MKDALAIHRMLLERETFHEIVRLPSTITDAEDLPGAGLPAERCLATRVFSFDPGEFDPGEDRTTDRTTGGLAAVVVLVGGTIGTEPLRRALGALSARPATADVVNSVTDFAVGLVCPLLLPASTAVLIDRGITHRLRGDDVVYTATGEHGTALGIRARDLYAASGAVPVDLRPVIASAEQPPGRARRLHRSTW